jgi:thymidylate synthase (FAD)
MKLIEQGYEFIIPPPHNTLNLIENAGRTCYKSESRGNPERFVRMLIKSGHHSVIEHVSASVRFITNRGVSLELVRHRLASYSQESTRYCRYDTAMEFIKPIWLNDWNEECRKEFIDACLRAEQSYNALLENAASPEQAREVLPNALKTEIVMSANLREWMHVFKLRCSAKAHPQMRALMKDVRQGFRERVKVLFE